MSILYQALSRAARDNARKTGAGSADAAETSDTPTAQPGNFTRLSFRPRRGRGSRRAAPIALAVIAALGIGA